MQTGYFAISGTVPGAIAISRTIPKFFHGPRYLALAPTFEMLRCEKDIYTHQYYHKILHDLTPQKVYDDLIALAGKHEPILLCWERSNTWCHRRLVAEWLEKALQIEIPEVGYTREQCLAYKDLPVVKKYKGPTFSG